MPWITLTEAAVCSCGQPLAPGARALQDRAGDFVGCNGCTARGGLGQKAHWSKGRQEIPSVTHAQADANYAALMARLDEDQREIAAWTPDRGNARVLAGAGSGKTSTSVALIATLVRVHRIPPARIVATTFTNKGGRELKERLAQLLPGDTYKALRIGTFHSLALRTLTAADPKKWSFQTNLDAEAGERRDGIPSAQMLWESIYGDGLIWGLKKPGFDIAQRSRSNARREIISGDRPSTTARSFQSSTLPPSPLSGVAQTGAWVSHPSFGAGRVRSVSGAGPTAKLSIAFSRGGVRTVIARAVELMPPDATDASEASEDAVTGTDRPELAEYIQAIEILRARMLRPGTSEARTACRDLLYFRLHDIWECYEQAKKALGAWDYGDTLRGWLDLFDAPEKALGALEADVVINDEAQDDTPIQTELVRRMAGAQGRILLIGDEKQAIFGWNGADPEHFVAAGEALAAKTYQIRYNYRSSHEIVALSNEFTADKGWRLGDPSKPGRIGAPSARFHILRGEDVVKEAEEIARCIEGCLQAGDRAEQIAVISRTNGTLGPVEAALMARRIPCAVVGGRSFFAGHDVQAMLSYLRHTADSCEPNEFKRLARTGPLGAGRIGLGEAFVAAVFAQTGVTLSEAVRRAALQQFSERQKHGRENALELAKALDLMEAAGRTGGWAGLVEATTRYLTGADRGENGANEKNGDQRNGDDGKGSAEIEATLDDRAAVFHALGAIALRFDGYRPLAAFAQACADGTVPEGTEVVIPGRVVLTSAHRGKGREFDTVIVMATRGVFPHAKSEDSPKAMAEEERLWYVAISRARFTLAASYSHRRGRGLGGPSPFLDGLWERTAQSRSIDQTMREIKAQWEIEKMAAREAAGTDEAARQRRRQEERSA